MNPAQGRSLKPRKRVCFSHSDLQTMTWFTDQNAGPQTLLQPGRGRGRAFSAPPTLIAESRIAPDFVSHRASLRRSFPVFLVAPSKLQQHEAPTPSGFHRAVKSSLPQRYLDRETLSQPQQINATDTLPLSFPLHIVSLFLVSFHDFLTIS